MNVRNLTLALILVASYADAQPASSPISVPPRLDPGNSVPSASISVSGITPYGKVVVLEILQLPQTRGRVISRREFLATDTDGSGTVRIDAGYAAKVAIWCAVDLTSGLYYTTTSPGYEVRRIDLPGRGVKRGISGQLPRVAAGHECLEGLVVRPAVGAWRFTVGDGGQSDADGSLNGRVEYDIEQMSPIGNSPPAPKQLLPHDTLILIDPFTMELFTSAVTP
jgi:hypothetical protein